MGFAMANKMGESLSPPNSSTAAAPPPPSPQQSKYFVAIDGQQSGPLSISELGSKIASGIVTQSTLVWNQTLVEWTPAGKVQELAAQFANKPPPLPSKNNPKKKK
jgi:hypothetical protein